MGDRITIFDDCPKCGSKGTFECYEALSCGIKVDECTKCGYVVNYEFIEKDGVIYTKKIDNPIKPPETSTSGRAYPSSSPSK